MDAVRHKHSDVVAFLKRNGAVLHHDKAKGLLHVNLVLQSPALLTLFAANALHLESCTVLDGCVHGYMNGWVHD